MSDNRSRVFGLGDFNLTDKLYFGSANRKAVQRLIGLCSHVFDQDSQFIIFLKPSG